MASGDGVLVEDALYQQARDVHGKDFEEWTGNLQSVLQLSDRGPSCLTILRQLYVITAVTKYSRNLSPVVYNLLRAVVLEPEQGPPRIRLLASAVLRELAPSSSIVVREFNPPVEESNIPCILPILLAQTNARERLSQMAPTIIRWLTQPGYDEDLVLAALSFLHALCSHGRALERLVEDNFRAVSMQLSIWLRQANRSSLSSTSSSSGISLFGGSAKKQLLPVKEIDGITSQDIFTILNIGGFYSPDQLLNIHAFSFLRRWLLTNLSSGSAPSPTPTSTPTSEVQRQILSSPISERRSISRSTPSYSFTSSVPSPLPSAIAQTISGSLTASLISPSRTRQGLKDAAVQYCLRVIDQCERTLFPVHCPAVHHAQNRTSSDRKLGRNLGLKQLYLASFPDHLPCEPVRAVDEELVKACLYESIMTLELLCSLSRSLTHGVFPTMKKLYTRFAQEPLAHGRLLLALVKFFVNHGESEMYDCETPINVFFGQVLSVKFRDPGLAYDTVEFLLESTERLHASTNIFTRYFPNILKILAWSPVTFVAEFLQLLPAFISKTSASEVLHSLLDLPCLSATLQAQYLSNSVNIQPQYAACLATFQDPTHRLMFGHFLRSETGRGDTIDRLSDLHHLLGGALSSHRRVMAAAQITPLLLKLYFKTVFYGRDVTVISQLVGVLLERIVVLYNVSSFQTEVRMVVAEQLLLIFRAHPHLVVDYHHDLLDYLSNIRNLSSGGEHCYLHLVWILGEYSHTGYDARCTTSLLVQYFETLESIAYEVGLNLHGLQGNYTTRLVLVLMSTMAKIASRCQDLIPRALLCLNKIVQLGSESSGNPSIHKVLLRRANELVNVLKIPSIASAVLSPPPHSSELQEMDRQTNLAFLLQCTSNHLQT